MISSSDKILECSICVNPTDVPTNIRKYEDGSFNWIGNIGGQSVIISINLLDKVIATSDVNDGLPNIGIDFLWEFTKNPVESVRGHFNSNGGIKINNGNVVISPIQKLYTEKDLYDILEYALGLFDKDRINEIISTYRKR